MAAARAKRTAAARDARATHAALLRAVNVGGTGVLPMAELKAIFEKAGAGAVRTLLASGNVLFAADDVDACVAQVKTALARRLGKEVAVMVRSLEQLRALVAASPFGGMKAPPGTTWYVSFLDRAPVPAPRLPLTVPTGDVTYLALVGRELCTTVTPPPGMTSVEHFKAEALFKVTATTRNWNSVLKLIAEKT